MEEPFLLNISFLIWHRQRQDFSESAVGKKTGFNPAVEMPDGELSCVEIAGADKKFKKAKSDAEPLPSEPDGLEGRPEADNLVGISVSSLAQG